VVIAQRSLTSKPRYSKHTAAEGEHLLHSVLRTQAATVGASNEYDFPINIFYRWWGSEEAPYIRNLQPRREAWQSTFRTTELVARTLDGQELQRFSVRSHGIMSVANRHCNVEDCGIVERPKEEVQLDDELRENMEWQDKARLANNEKQKHLPKFTDVGFAKVNPSVSNRNLYSSSSCCSSSSSRSCSSSSYYVYACSAAAMPDTNTVLALEQLLLVTIS
jgi:hypothetical protein